jgi:hypothetical protein
MEEEVLEEIIQAPLLEVPGVKATSQQRLVATEKQGREIPQQGAPVAPQVVPGAAG